MLLLLLAALVIWTAVPAAGLVTGSVAIPGYDDRQLYRNIADKISRGQGYYAAADAEHRAHHYPTTPPQVFREPTLAWSLAMARTDFARRALLVALTCATLIAMRIALDHTRVTPRFRLPAILLAATGVSLVGAPDATYLHEVWAALLIALSLACHRPDRWALSVGLGVLACLVRELAAPYLAVMAMFAVLERRPREAAAWAGGMIAFALLFAAHLARAAALHKAGDLASGGWVAWGGPSFVLETARWNLLLHPAPAPLVALGVVSALVGLAGWRDGLMARSAAVVGGYMAAFLIVGRPENFYWGILYAPLLPLGWVAAPAAFRDIFRQAWPSRTA